MQYFVNSIILTLWHGISGKKYFNFIWTDDKNFVDLLHLTLLGCYRDIVLSFSFCLCFLNNFFFSWYCRTRLMFASMRVWICVRPYTEPMRCRWIMGWELEWLAWLWVEWIGSVYVCYSKFSLPSVAAKHIHTHTQGKYWMLAKVNIDRSSPYIVIRVINDLFVDLYENTDIRWYIGVGKNLIYSINFLILCFAGK